MRASASNGGEGRKNVVEQCGKRMVGPKTKKGRKEQDVKGNEHLGGLHANVVFTEYY
jgi:hypothetical protein